MKNLAIVLSAGYSEKMKSYVNKSSKLTYLVLDTPIICYVSQAISFPSISKALFVVGHKKEDVISVLGENNNYVIQNEINGTLNAVRLCDIKDYDNIIVIYGCMPCIKSESIKTILNNHIENNYDVSYCQGLYVFKRNILEESLKMIGVFEIDDAIELLKKDGKNMRFINLSSTESLIVKNRVDLATANKLMQNEINQMHMLKGITIVDPSNTYIGKNAVIGNDTIIYPNTYIYGKSMVGVSCELGPNAYIIDSFIDNYSVLCNCSIKQKSIKNK